MGSIWRDYKLFWITLLVISTLILAGIYYALAIYPEKQLPIYQPAQVSEALVDENIQHVNRNHTIADFELINQNGNVITHRDYADKIYVADFFFTTCQTICPLMTKNMHRVQAATISDNDIMLLSHTVTPEIDTVAQLKRYAEEKMVNRAKWNLVTGDKKQIYKLARQSYLAVKEGGDGGPFDMIHTENFMLIDKERRIRGFYDGTNEDEIDRLLDDIKILKQSYSN